MNLHFSTRNRQHAYKISLTTIHIFPFRILQKEIADLYLKLYCKHEAIQCCHEDFESMSDLDKIASEIIKKIDALNKLERYSVESNKKSIIMKVTVRLLSDLQKQFFSSYVQDLENFLESMEPFKYEPSGIYPYILILIQMAFRKRKNLDDDEASQYAFLAEKEHKRYLKSTTLAPLSFYELCDLPELRKQESKLETLPFYISFVIWKIHNSALLPESLDITMPYLIPAIRYCLYNFKPDLHPCYNLELMNNLADLMFNLVEKKKFKQLAHVLAKVWVKIYDYRRSLSPLMSRRDLDEPQGKLSVVYTKWGKQIVADSLNKINGNEIELYDNETFEVFDVETESDTKEFESQFPIEPICSKEEIKRYYKRAKQWNLRSLKLLENFTSTTDLNEIPFWVHAGDDERRLEELKVKLQEAKCI